MKSDRWVPVLIIMMIFLVVATPIVTAGKNYDPDTQTYNMTDYLFFKKYDIRLIDYDDSLIDSWARGDLMVHKDTKVFKKLYYLDEWGNKKDFKEGDYKIYVNNSYQGYNWIRNMSCETTDYGNGTVINHSCEEVPGGEWVNDSWRVNWVEINYSDKLEPNYYLWKIEAQKPINQKVDWVIETDDEGNLTEWAWWDNSWLYKKEITLTGNVGNLSTFTVNQTTTCQSNCQSDFDDLRFTDSTETTELNYTIRHKIDGDYALVTVATNAETTVYMYYGNAGATAGSNVNDTYFSPHALYYLDDYAGSVLDAGDGGFDGNSSTGDFGEVGYVNNSYGFVAASNDLSQAGTNLWPGPFASVDDYTVLVKIKVDSYAGSGNGILSQPFGSGSTGRMNFLLDGGNQTITFSANDDGNLWGSVIGLAAWHTVGIKRDGATTYLYTNGSVDGSETKFDNGYWVAPTEIGRALKNNDWDFDGNIDEIIAHRVALTDVEVAKLSTSTEPTVAFGSQQLNNMLPQVTLTSPANDTTVNSNGYTTTYSALSIDYDGTLQNCTLTLWNLSTGGVAYTQTNLTPTNNTQVTFSQTVMSSNYTWNVECVDDENGANSSLVNFTINVLPIADDAPVVTLQAPANNTQYLTSPVAIDFSCVASDDNILENVSLIINSVINQTNTSGINNSNYSFTTTFGDGSYTWSCRATDNSSQSTEPTARSFTVDGGAPAVVIDAPANGSTVTEFNQSFFLNWTVSDPNLDRCWYTGPYTPDPQNVGDFNTSLTFTGAQSYNFSENQTLAVPTNADITASFSGANIVIGSANGFTELSIASTNPSCFNASYNPTFTANTELEKGKYVCFKLNDGTYAMANLTGNATLDWKWLNRKDVDCATSSDLTNYPSDNPESLDVTLYASDTLNRTNSSTVTLVKSKIAPIITITSPVDQGLLNNASSLSLNYSITNTTTLDVCIYEYNGINNTLSCTGGNQTFTYFSPQNTITVYANDTLGNMNSTTQTWTVNYSETGVEFNSPVFEGSSETFKLNVTVAAGNTIAEAHLLYNGTSVNDTSSLSVAGNDYILTNTIEAPGVTVDTNYTFTWEIIFSSGIVLNSSNYNQTVQPINIDDCSSYNETIYNLTMYYETNRTKITPGSNISTEIEVDLQIYSAVGSQPFLLFSQTYDDINPAQICLDQNLTDTGYLADLQVRYGATGQTTELYHIDVDTLDNSTVPRQVGLYPLNVSRSTSFNIEYKGSDFLAVSGAIIQIQRKYIGDGVYLTVEAPKTDENGQAVGHFEIENVVYSIVIVKNGTILDSFREIVVRCENPLTSECTLQLSSFESGSGFEEWDQVGDLTFNAQLNDEDREVIVQFNTVSGSARTVTLTGTRFDGNGNVTVCSDTLFSSAGTLNCSVDNVYGNISVIFDLSSNGATVTTASVNMAETIYDALGDDSYFFILVIVMITPLLFIPSTIMMVIAGVIGVMLSIVVLFLDSSSLFSQGAALTWLIIAGIIIIWKIARRETI